MAQINDSIGEYPNVKLPEKVLSFTNCVYLSPTDLLFSHSYKNPPRVIIKNIIYNVIFNKAIPDATIGLSAIQREDLSVKVGEKISIRPIVVETITDKIDVKIMLRCLVDKYPITDSKSIIELFQSKSQGLVISKGQHFLIDKDGVPIKIGIVGWDSDLPVEISNKTNFIVINKIEEIKSDGFHYFELNNRWFQVSGANKITKAVRNLIANYLNKGLIKSFTDTSDAPVDKPVGNYNGLRVYVASLFLGLVDE